MEKNLTSREVKRIESDKKILRATIEIVGEKGYTNANIRDIAKRAGITPGLITQRFETKEKLLIQAIYSTGVVWIERHIPEDTRVDVLLKGIIGEAKSLYKRDNAAYRFLQILSNSTDVPAEVIFIQRKHFHENGVYKVLSKAQQAGYIPEGELSVLYNIFLSHTLNLIGDYTRAGLKIPDDMDILAMIQYKDPEKEEQNYLRNKAFESISKSYFVLCYFNIYEDSYRIERAPDKLLQIEKKCRSSQGFLNKAIKETIDIEYQGAVKEFVDLSTVLKRLENKRLIAIDCTGQDSNRYRISFVFVIKESKKEVVLCGVQKIEDNA